VVNLPRLHTVDHGLFINAFSTVGDILRSDDTRRVIFLVNMKKFRNNCPWHVKVGLLFPYSSGSAEEIDKNSAIILGGLAGN
jgi:hypothetical protein